MDSLEVVKAAVDMDALVKALRGRDGGLRPSKPKTANGLVKYVWRMARFHSGADPTMPIMCAFDLQDWLDERKLPAKVSGILNAEGKEVSKYLDAVAEEVVKRLGGDPLGGARRWARAFGMI